MGPVCSSCGVSNTDFVNSGSYLRTVFVFISGITTFTGRAGGVGFLASGLTVAVVGAVGKATAVVLPMGTGVDVGLAGAWAGAAFAAGACVFDKAAGAWLLAADLDRFAAGLEILPGALEILAGGLEKLDTAVFLG